MKKPRALGVEPEKIDILASEINENLPYWLNPIVKYSNSPRVRATRMRKWREHWANRQSETVEKEFDESKHPRDERGRWTDAGGSEGAASSWDKVPKLKNKEVVTGFIEGPRDEIREDARQKIIEMGDSTHEVAVLIGPQRFEGSKEFEGAEIAVASGGKGSVGIPTDIVNDFGDGFEFLHNHPERTPMSGPDLATLNKNRGELAGYAYTVDGGISKLTIPGRDLDHPLQWLGGKGSRGNIKTGFDRFMGKYSQHYFATTEPDAAIDALIRKVPPGEFRTRKQQEEFQNFVDNYVLMKGLENAGIVNHDHTPDAWQQQQLKNYKNELAALVKLTTRWAKEEKQKAGLVLQ